MMKILAILIVMANIIFFLWEYRAGALQPSDKKLQGSTATHLQSIRLVSEVRRELEDKMIGQSEAIKERFPFVSDFFRVQVAAGNLDVDPHYQFLPQGKPIALLGSLNTASETVEINAAPAPAKSLQIADAGEKSTAPEAGASIPKPKTISPSSEREIVSGASMPASDEAGGESRLPSGARSAEHAPVDDSHVDRPDGSAQSAEITLCYKAGPFKDMTLYEQWRMQTGMALELITPIRHEGREVTGYLVYYPAPADYEQALANVAMLKRKGITDYWLFRKGESRGEISLGLFRNKTRAEKLERQLLAKGLDVLIKPRFKNSSQLYARISITSKDQEKLMIGQDQWRRQHPGFTIEADSDCALTSEEHQE